MFKESFSIADQTLAEKELSDFLDLQGGLESLDDLIKRGSYGNLAWFILRKEDFKGAHGAEEAEIKIEKKLIEELKEINTARRFFNSSNFAEYIEDWRKMEHYNDLLNIAKNLVNKDSKEGIHKNWLKEIRV